MVIEHSSYGSDSREIVNLLGDDPSNALTCAKLQFLRSDLSVGVISRDSCFSLDLAHDAMTATSVFSIVIAG